MRTDSPRAASVLLVAALLTLANGPAAAGTPLQLSPAAAAQVAGALPDPATSPPALAQAVRDYVALKPLTASSEALAFIGAQPSAADVAAAEYLLARCFYDVEMYDAAERLFLGAVDRGPTDPWFAPSLERATRIAGWHGEWSALDERILRISPEQFPPKMAADLAWLRGRALFRAGDDAGAVASLGAPVDTWIVGPRTRYLLGVAQARRGELGAAKQAFIDVIRAVDGRGGERIERREARSLDRSRDRAVLSLAELYFRAERWEEAGKLIAAIKPDSPSWPEAALVDAHLHAGDDRALRRIATALEKRGAPASIRAEADLVRMARFDPCGGPELDIYPDAAASRWRPALTDLAARTMAWSADPTRAWSDFESGALDDALPFVRLDPTLAAVRTHLTLLARERDHIDAQRADWRATVGAYAKLLLRDEEARLRKLGGAAVIARVRREQEALGETVRMFDDLARSVANCDPGQAPD